MKDMISYLMILSVGIKYLASINNYRDLEFFDRLDYEIPFFDGHYGTLFFLLQ